MIVPRHFPSGARNISTCPNADHVDTQVDHIIATLPPIPIADEQCESAAVMLRRDPLAFTRAKRMLVCPPVGTPTGRNLGFVRYPCKQRGCPQCAERRARGMADRAIDAAATYGHPAAVLVTCPSRTLLDLPSTLDRLRDSLARMRRRRWFSRGCRAGVVIIETPRTSDGRRWALHAHGVIDLAAPLGAIETTRWTASAQREWSALTGQPGSVFAVEALGGTRALLRYAAKVGDAKSWSPGPRELSPTMYAHLDRALRGRRLLIAWGGSRS